MKFIAQNINTILLLIIAMALGAIAMRMQDSPNENNSAPIVEYLNLQAQQAATDAARPTETIPPYTPFASATPSRTLLPPPTLQPPTATREATLTPSITPTSTIGVDVTVAGLRGAESPTPITTPDGCEKRADWKLTYTVQFNDALARIAEKYNTSVDTLVAGNCLADADKIYEGQVLRVPGEVQPAATTVNCSATWEALTPFNDSHTVPSEGDLTFNWRGPETPRYLVRVTRPDGVMLEKLIELRENATFDLFTELHQGGRYYWTIVPLNFDFVQVCTAGGPFTFMKGEGATLTPTPTTQSQPPQVNFIFAPMDPHVNDIITFANQTAGDITSYHWTFGEGSSSEDQHPTHYYTAPGNYVVTLTATGPGGTGTSSTIITVLP